MNSSSRAEAISLLSKLREEQSSVHVVLRSNGIISRLTGVFGGSSTGKDLIVIGNINSGYLSVPFAGREYDFNFSDKRERSADTQNLADRWGNCALHITFSNGDLLTFIFDLP